MPRHARFLIADHAFHVRQRGVDGAACFRSEADRRLYLGLLAELAEPMRCAIHGYVLMTNHVHLLVTPSGADGLPRMMKHLGQRYSQHCNRTWPRFGPLWDGRFRSSPVDSARYALTCLRYIELNPVRAGMVRHPAEYAWSSFRANAYGTPCAFLTSHVAYQALAPDDVGRRLAYRALFDVDPEEGELELIREAIDGGFVYGSAEFIARVEAATGRRVRRAKRAGAHRLGARSGLSPV